MNKVKAIIQKRPSPKSRDARLAELEAENAKLKKALAEVQEHLARQGNFVPRNPIAPNP